MATASPSAHQAPVGSLGLFDKPFGNNDYSIACTPSMNSGDDLQRYMTVRDKTTANYEVQTWSTGGGRSGVGGSCIAFGVPGGSW